MLSLLVAQRAQQRRHQRAFVYETANEARLLAQAHRLRECAERCIPILLLLLR
jgi:hypothetical protein